MKSGSEYVNLLGVMEINTIRERERERERERDREREGEKERKKEKDFMIITPLILLSKENVSLKCN